MTYKFKIGLAAGTLLAAGTILLYTWYAYAAESPVITVAVLNGSNATTTTAAIGTVVHDRTILGTASSTLDIPTGTVDFSRYSNTTCSGTSVVESGVVLVGGVAVSGTTTVPGTGLSYKVHYNGQGELVLPGDSECHSVVATAPSVTIGTVLSTTTAQVGTFVYDTATLGNATANATGSVAYSVFTNSSCSSGQQSAGSKTVADGAVSNSDSIQFNVPGTYYWQAVYTGDQYNSGATSICSSEPLTIVAPPGPKGHIIVDKQTSPVGDGTSFVFTTTGSGYTGFSLTDQSQPNNQELAIGTYTVQESVLSGWSLTSATCSTNGAASTTYTPGANLSLGANDVVRCLFLNTKQSTSTNGSLSGIVFNDLNKNKKRDSGEPGLSGFTVNLYSNTEHSCKSKGDPSAHAITDANGQYVFPNLVDGTYSIEEIRKSGWKQISSDFFGVKVTNGIGKTDADFANVAATSTSGDDEDGDSDSIHHFPFDKFKFPFWAKGHMKIDSTKVPHDNRDGEKKEKKEKKNDNQSNHGERGEGEDGDD